MDTLYHYTSVENLFKILGSKDDKICFRATHAQFMNDPSDYKLAIEVLKEVIVNYGNKTENAKSKWLSDETNIFHEISYVLGEPFLLSFSEDPNNLTMWRTYGKNGLGVSIGLDFEMIEKYRQSDESGNTYILKCDYDKYKILKELVEYWKKNSNGIHIFDKGRRIDTNNFDLLFMIPNLCFKAKDKAYEIEQEWRLCKNESDESNIRFGVRSDMIMPYIEHIFEKKIVKKIYIGPCVDEELSLSSMKMFLKGHGFDVTNDFVTVSKVPYRRI